MARAQSTVAFLAWAVLLTGCTGQAAAPIASGDPKDLPQQLEIVCTEQGQTRFPGGESVAAQADGVHLRIDNRAGEPVSINGTRVDADPGISDGVTDEPPGTLHVACWPFSQHENSEPPTTAVTVADPGGVWIDDQLGCSPSGMTSNTIIDYAPSAGDPTDPVLQARRKAGPDLDDAEFGYAGYPKAADPTVVARRDGTIVAVFGFYRGTGDGWLLGGVEACA